MNRRSASVCNTCFTVQALGNCKVMRCLPCRTCTAILNSLAMTVDGWACARAPVLLDGIGARGAPCSEPL